MTVDIAFQFAKVYSIERADIVAGQSFKLFTDFENPRWFSDNDPVLSLSINGKEIEGKAEQAGVATLLIMDSNLQIQKKLSITVVEEIKDPAVDLGITAGSAIEK